MIVVLVLEFALASFIKLVLIISALDIVNVSLLTLFTLFLPFLSDVDGGTSVCVMSLHVCP